MVLCFKAWAACIYMARHNWSQKWMPCMKPVWIGIVVGPFTVHLRKRLHCMSFPLTHVHDKSAGDLCLAGVRAVAIPCLQPRYSPQQPGQLGPHPAAVPVPSTAPIMQPLQASEETEGQSGMTAAGQTCGLHPTQTPARVGIQEAALLTDIAKARRQYYYVRRDEIMCMFPSTPVLLFPPWAHCAWGGGEGGRWGWMDRGGGSLQGRGATSSLFTTRLVIHLWPMCSGGQHPHGLCAAPAFCVAGVVYLTMRLVCQCCWT